MDLLKDIRGKNISVAGVEVPLELVAEYLFHLYKIHFEQSGFFNPATFEYLRRQIHQKFYTLAGLDRVEDRESEFGKQLEIKLGIAQECPFHGCSLDNNNECPKCNFKLDGYEAIVKNILINLADNLYEKVY